MEEFLYRELENGADELLKNKQWGGKHSLNKHLLLLQFLCVNI